MAYRLSPIWDQRLIQLGDKRLLSLLGSKSYLICQSYLQDKITKSPFKSKGKRAKELLELYI